MVVRRQGVGVLRPLGQADFRARKAERHELDGQPGLLGAFDDELDPQSVEPGSEEADMGAAARKHMRHVDHGDDVALFQERHQDEVWLRTISTVHGCLVRHLGRQGMVALQRKHRRNEG